MKVSLNVWLLKSAVTAPESAGVSSNFLTLPETSTFSPGKNISFFTS